MCGDISKKSADISALRHLKVVRHTKQLVEFNTADDFTKIVDQRPSELHVIFHHDPLRH